MYSTVRLKNFVSQTGSTLRGLATGNLSLSNVQQSLREHVANVFVIERVKDHLAVLAVLDKPRLPELPQLVRNGRFRHTEQNGKVTDAHLGVLQGAEDFHACGVAEDLEQVGQIHKRFFVEHFPPYFRDHFLVNRVAIATVELRYLRCHVSYLRIQ
jgi:hypothetical protein